MDTLANLQKLPPMCAARHPGTNEPILIRRGEPGFIAWRPGPPLRERDRVAYFNARHKVTPQQVAAMLHGSQMGWSCPAADPGHDSNTARAVMEGRPREWRWSGDLNVARQEADHGL